MGWSCRAEAGDTMRAMSEACGAQTGSSNSYRALGNDAGAYDPCTYTGKQTPTHFWEASRVEHSDGRVTGAVWKMLPEDHAKQVGRFRISAEGRLEVAPFALRQVVQHYHGRNF